MSEGEPGRMERLERQMQELGERLAAVERTSATQAAGPPAPSWPGAPAGGPAEPAPASWPVAPAAPPVFGPADAGGPGPGYAGGPGPGYAGGPGPGYAGGPGPAAADDESWFTYGGRIRFGGRTGYIQQRGRLADVLNANPERIAKVFTALGSPARIILLRALLGGPRTSQELRQELDDPSVGQLYHHLKELLAAGLVIQPGRSVYALPRGSEISLCIQILTAAQMLPAGLATQPPEPEEDPAEEDPAEEDDGG